MKDILSTDSQRNNTNTDVFAKIDKLNEFAKRKSAKNECWKFLG